MKPLALLPRGVVQTNWQSKACEGWVTAVQGSGAKDGGRVAGAWEHACHSQRLGRMREWRCRSMMGINT